MFFISTISLSNSWLSFCLENFSKIEESIKLIVNSGLDYEFRTTVVPGIHNEEEIENLGLWVNSIVEDKPILMDYWTSSIEKTALIGVKDDSEKLLVKSEEEYTSPISKIFKVEKEYIIMTENSIYLVDVSIPTKRISS